MHLLVVTYPMKLIRLDSTSEGSLIVCDLYTPFSDKPNLTQINLNPTVCSIIGWISMNRC
jgi:hypothetical protein